MRDDMLSEVQIPTDVYDFELDKIQGFWVVTSWPGPDVVLRLRIRYWSREDLCDVICEARIGTCTEFEEIGRFEASLWELRRVRQSSPSRPPPPDALWGASPQSTAGFRVDGPPVGHVWRPAGVWGNRLSSLWRRTNEFARLLRTAVHHHRERLGIIAR
jgi:hypothetical protein